MFVAFFIVCTIPILCHNKSGAMLYVDDNFLSANNYYNFIFASWIHHSLTSLVTVISSVVRFTREKAIYHILIPKPPKAIIVFCWTLTAYYLTVIVTVSLFLRSS